MARILHVYASDLHLGDVVPGAWIAAMFPSLGISTNQTITSVNIYEMLGGSGGNIVIVNNAVAFHETAVVEIQQ
jgi:hypothetical protein